jgi:hypothetical protein
MERRIIKNATAFLIGMSFIVGVARAEAQSAYSAQVNHRPTAQERSVQRDVQAAIDQWIEELAANDLQAVSRQMSDGFTIRLLDGTTLNHAQAIEGMRRDLEGILKIDSDRTYARIECLTL